VNSALKPVSKYWSRVTRVEQLRRKMREAFDAMLEPGSEGPAVLCLPMDVQAESAEFDTSLYLAPVDRVYPRICETPEKISQALFFYARAATYDGPGSLAPQGRAQIDDYLRKAYNSYHGQDDAGLTELKNMAKSQPMPPPNFKVKTANEIAIEKEEEFKKSNPQLALWMSVKKLLTADDGAQYFETNVKNSAFPKMKGTVIEAKPETRSRELVVGLADPTVPEATLKLDAALTGKPKVGSTIEWEGVPSAFSKDPFMLTFDVERAKIEGLEMEAAPKPTGKKRAAPRGKK
jgi:hypothetical protein